jgi:hypothetical protein
MSNTWHAQARMQQRGVPPLIIQWLEAFGEEHHDHHGAIILYFSKRSRRRLEQNFGSTPLRRLGEWMNAYAVIGSDGTLVTTGTRWKRIKQ